jgi:hypothetical protein
MTPAPGVSMERQRILPAALVFAALSLLAACDSSAPSEPAHPSVEYEIARLDAGGPIAQDDARIVQARTLLAQLSKTYNLTPAQIGDQTAAAQKMLREDHVQESLMDLMTDMDGLFSTPQPPNQYAEALAIYETSREHGASREDAVRGLRDIARLSGHH